jgi:signal peptidase I
VIVFRYPVDESEDFIKRVIGLPGDTIRVEGNKVLLKREGATEFEELQRTQADREVPRRGRRRSGPALRALRGDARRAHVPRPLHDRSDPRLGGQRRFGEWRVPDRHYLVMGDNRNQSHDSLAWTKQVEAVAADGLLSVKDLRDLTPEKLFTLVRPDEASVREDSSYDHIVYMADHASDAHGLQLAVWRDPALGSAVVYATLAGRGQLPHADPSGRPVGRRRAARRRDPQRGRPARASRSAAKGIEEVAYRKDDGGYEAAIHLAGAAR